MFNSLAALFSNIKASPTGQLPASAPGPDSPASAESSFESILAGSVQRNDFRPIAVVSAQDAGAQVSLVRAQDHKMHADNGITAFEQPGIITASQYLTSGSNSALNPEAASIMAGSGNVDVSPEMLQTVVLSSFMAESGGIVIPNELMLNGKELFLELEIPSDILTRNKQETLIIPASVTGNEALSGMQGSDELSGSFVVPVYSLNELFGLEQNKSTVQQQKDVLTAVAPDVSGLTKIKDLPAKNVADPVKNIPMTVSLEDLKPEESLITLTKEIVVQVTGNNSEAVVTSDEISSHGFSSASENYLKTESAVVKKPEIVFTGSEMVIESSGQEKIRKAVENFISSFAETGIEETDNFTQSSISIARAIKEEDSAQTASLPAEDSDASIDSSKMIKLFEGINLRDLLSNNNELPLPIGKGSTNPVVSIDNESLKEALVKTISEVINNDGYINGELNNNKVAGESSKDQALPAEMKFSGDVKLPLELIVTVPVESSLNATSGHKLSSLSKDVIPSAPVHEEAAKQGLTITEQSNVISKLTNGISEAVQGVLEEISSSKKQSVFEERKSGNPAQKIDMSYDTSVSKTSQENLQSTGESKTAGNDANVIRLLIPVEVSVSQESIGDIAKNISEKTQAELVKVLEENAPVRKFFESLSDDLTGDIKKVDITLGSQEKPVIDRINNVSPEMKPHYEPKSAIKSDTSVQTRSGSKAGTPAIRTESIDLDLSRSTVKADDQKIVLTFKPENEESGKPVNIIIEKQDILSQAAAGREEYTVKARLEAGRNSTSSNENGVPLQNVQNSESAEEITLTLNRNAVQKLMLSRNQLQAEKPSADNKVFDRNASGDTEALKNILADSDKPIKVRIPLNTSDNPLESASADNSFRIVSKPSSKDIIASETAGKTAESAKPGAIKTSMNVVLDEAQVPAKTAVTISKDFKEGRSIYAEGTLVFKPVEKAESKADIKAVQSAEKAAEQELFRFEPAQDRDGGMKDGGRRESMGEFRENTNVLKSADQSFARIHTEKVISTEHILKMQDAAPESEAKTPVRATWHTSELADNIMQRTSQIRKNSDTEMRIQLIPPHLGKMVLKLRVEDQNVIARVQVESTEAKSIMQDNLPQLKEAMNDRGMEIQKFDVDVRQDFNQNLNQSQWSGFNKDARGNSARNSDQNSGKGNVLESMDEVVPGEKVRTFGYNTMELTA